MSKGKKLRQIFSGDEIVLLPAVFDSFSALLVQQRGFKAGFISGAGLSESRLGLPDIGLMGFEDNLEASRAIASRCDIPFIADCDTGYGNAVNVYFVLKNIEQAGLAGLMIEDQAWPKRCGHMAGKRVISADEMVEKIVAAGEARQDPDFIILSRTDAYGTDGLAEAISRLQKYSEAGADLLFADAVLKEEDIRTIASELDKPVVVNMGFGIRERSTTPLISAKELKNLGVSAVIYSRLLSASAIRGMMNGLDALQDDLAKGTVKNRPELAVSFEELNELVGLSDIRNLETHFTADESSTARCPAG